MRFVFLTPSPDPPGGGAQFNAGLIPALRTLGHHVTVQHDAQNLPETARPVIDGLLLPDLEPAADLLIARRAIAIIHHVAARSGHDRSTKDQVTAAERRLLPGLHRVLATSQPVADRLATAYGLLDTPVLTPGLPDLPRSPNDSAATACHILSAGVLTARKGHDRLLHALAPLTDLDWTLTVAGDTTRDPTHAAAVAALIDDLLLAARVTLLPDPSGAALEAEWARANLFALASSWEAYPASLAEALRRGLPILATDVGDIPALVPPSAGILCKPDDPATFSKCLRRAIFDRHLRATLAEGAWQAGQALPGWPQQAQAFLSLIED